MIPLDDVGLSGDDPVPHTCVEHPTHHCHVCDVEGRLRRYSQAFNHAVRGHSSAGDIILRSTGERVACYCGCGLRGYDRGE